jgi:GT2 family glycosyltransferase
VGTPQLSVVIPTHNRSELLGRCLTALERAVGEAEVEAQTIVVDDASTDTTDQLVASFSGVQLVKRSVDGGSSAARNEGVRKATAPLVLFIDDDIVVEPDLISRHLGHHSRHPQAEEALVGLVTWTQERPISAHMRWLERGGPLFAFDTIADPSRVDPSHFCTANVSVKRELLSRVEGPFDERLRRFTDVELGQRLNAVGMRLRFDPDAIGWHLRSDTPATTDQRMRAVGRASVRLDQVHPGLAPEAAPDTLGKRSKAKLAKLVTPLAPALPPGVADRIWSARAAWAYAEGRREAEAERQ